MSADELDFVDLLELEPLDPEPLELVLLLDEPDADGFELCFVVLEADVDTVAAVSTFLLSAGSLPDTS